MEKLTDAPVGLYKIVETNGEIDEEWVEFESFILKTSCGIFTVQPPNTGYVSCGEKWHFIPNILVERVKEIIEF